MSPPPIVALEIGTSRIRAVVGEVRNQDHVIMVTGVGECESRGVRKGDIIDFDNAMACVRTALQSVEDNGRVIVNQVHLALSGGHIQSLMNRGSVPIPNGEITPDDIRHVMETARAISLPPDRQVMHTVSQHFFVDDQDGVINPEGMEGQLLSLDMLILHGVRNRLRNVAKVVKSLGVEVEDVAFGGLCSALAVLTPEDKENGVAMLDLGAGTTDYVVYARAAIAAAGCIGVGGDHVTNDIACGFRISIAEAERLKEECGSAIPDIANHSKRVKLASDTGRPERSGRLSDLHTIVHFRMEELFTMVRAQLAKENLLRAIGSGIVLTGGGSAMREVTRLAEKVFGLPCRIGKPRNVSGLSMATEGAQYATAVGMLRYGFKTAGRDSGLSLWDRLRDSMGSFFHRGRTGAA